MIFQTFTATCYWCGTPNMECHTESVGWQRVAGCVDGERCREQQVERRHIPEHLRGDSMGVSYIYWTLPNNTSEYSLLSGAVEEGWEIYGYSEYHDGRPSKVKLRKEKKL